MTARIIRIILPADTTVAVGDTLWWGVEGDCGFVPHRLDQPCIPPEWQALTEACHRPPSSLALELAGEARCVECDPDCHEGQRTVEVTTVCDWCNGSGEDVIVYYGGDQHPDEYDREACEQCDGTGGVSLGRAVIDGDWVRHLSINDWFGTDLPPVPNLTTIDGTVFLITSHAISTWGEEQIITLHGHTNPGGYAARFEIVEVPSS